MSQSRAISPEVRGIFERIENQADEYEKAFNELNKLYRDSDRLKRENEELLYSNNQLFERNNDICKKLENIEDYINLRLEYVFEEIVKYLESNIIDTFKVKTEMAIVDFENRASEAIGLIEGVTGIVTLLDKARNFADETDKKMLLIDEQIDKLKYSNKEFNDSHEDLNILKLQFEEAILDVDHRIADAMKGLQGKIEVAFNELTFSLEERIKTTLVDVKNAQTVINQKIRVTDGKIDKFVDVSNKLELHLRELKLSTNTTNNKVLDNLKLRVEETYNKLNKEIEAINNNLLLIQNQTEKQFKIIKFTDMED